MSDDAIAHTFTVTPIDPRPCSACGRDMVDHASQSSFVGLAISFTVEPPSAHPDYSAAFRRIYPELPFPLQVDICYSCWIRSLGVYIQRPAAVDDSSSA